MLEKSWWQSSRGRCIQEIEGIKPQKRGHALCFFSQTVTMTCTRLLITPVCAMNNDKVRLQVSVLCQHCGYTCRIKHDCWKEQALFYCEKQADSSSRNTADSRDHVCLSRRNLFHIIIPSDLHDRKTGLRTTDHHNRNSGLRTTDQRRSLRQWPSWPKKRHQPSRLDKWSWHHRPSLAKWAQRHRSFKCYSGIRWNWGKWIV